MRRTLFALAATMLFTLAVFGQTTFATITGLVTDPNGASVVGAAVTATQVGSNYRYTAQTNQTGYYTIGQLLEGEYIVQVAAPDFSTYRVADVRIGNPAARRLEVQLEVGTVRTTVTVEAGASMIETETAR